MAAGAVMTATAQTIEYQSMNRKQGFPAILEHRIQLSDRINGTLTRPPGASGDVPAMVIMHSSGGIIPNTWEWSKFFLDMGIATFVVDSFGPRGITTTTMDQSQLSYPASTVDALLALKLLAAQPGIDAKRIGVIGFSRGAAAAAASSLENIRAAVLGDSPLKFALHIPYYGGCSQVGTTTGAPLLYFVGKEDDFISAELCAVTVGKMKERGANVADFVQYPNTYHSFDVENEKPRYYIANAQAWKKCILGQDMDDLSYFADGKKVNLQEYNDYYQRCMTRGATIASNFQAKTDSRARTKAFVSKVFGL